MRVHELAKELGISSKELLEHLEKKKIEAKSHMANLDAAVAAAVLKELSAPKTTAVPAPKKEEKKPEAVKQPVITAPKAPAAVLPKPAPAPEVKPTPAEPIKQAAPPPPPPPAQPSAEELAIKENLRRKEEEQKARDNAPVVSFPVTVGALAEILQVAISTLIKTLMEIGVFANVNQLLNDKTAFAAADKLGLHIKKEEQEEDLKKMIQDEAHEDLVLRSPVVTLMGHVDHGKTSLLDALRSSNVADKEHGRITQHIGAYGIEVKGKGNVTFLDTPGHEAFTAMRARGANVTDVVVLVVAADDGVMPQTIEAIDHAQAANVPIVVAINKCDLPAANPMKVKSELQKYNLIPEDWGGKTIFVEVSAKTGKGLEELLEMLLLEAEILDLKANPKKPARGTVLESKLTKNRGPVASVLVQNGTLKIGDALFCGEFHGKIRSMHNDRGKTVKEAGPSYAVELQGLNGTPDAGAIFSVVADEREARKIAEKQKLVLREKAMQGNLEKHMTLEGLYNKLLEGQVKELKLILKADVQGSIEALREMIEKIESEKVSIRIIHATTGAINDSDVMLAAASDAVIIGFHVRPDVEALKIAEKEGVEIRTYSIIYEAYDSIRKALEGMLEPMTKEVIMGRAQIRQIFKSSKVGLIAGSMVVKGKIVRTNLVRLIRNGVVLYEGKLASLKRFKDDVKEVQEGFDCGISLEGFDEIQEGDSVESFKLEKIAATL